MNLIEPFTSNRIKTNGSSNEITDLIQPSVIEQERFKWHSYLTRKRKDKTNLNKVDQHRIALTEYFYNLQQNDDRTIFHLTITYKPYLERTYSPKDTDTFFKMFYLNYLLPNILHTKNIHTEYKKSIQPICYVFTHEHKKDRVKDSSRLKNNPTHDRLHHHAILAVHPINVPFFESLPERDPFPTSLKFTSRICTSHIRHCEPMTLLYASDEMRKYPDFLCFPDKFYRERH